MSNLKYPRIVGYQLVERIGGGGFSTVYKAVNFEQQRVAACKVVPLNSETTQQDRKMLDKEIRVHSAMKHINVLEFLNAVIVEPEAKTKYYPAIYMLLELASGGDLFDKIAPDIGVDEEIAQHYFLQLISGLQYIHDQGVCHRDLKPENLLLDVAGRLKISDFGLCSVFRHKESGRVRLLTERCGSLPYVAPELNSDAPYQAEPVDIWGTGVILFTLLTGNTPWDEPSSASPEFVRFSRGTIFGESPWNRLSADAMSLIREILTINPRERTTLSDILGHPWCMRPSQVASEPTTVLAQRLTQSLHTNGDIDVIDPHSNAQEDHDGDVPMSLTYQSQFTQSLLLFSQTQSGRRYVPHLTRFYSSIQPTDLTNLVIDALQALGVKCKSQPPPANNNGTESNDSMNEDTEVPFRVRVGGFDRRKEMFKGWVEIESFIYRGQSGSFCIMQRDQGNPISWRQLWKALVKHPTVEPHVLRRS